ncbi:MAG TPA: hypothetical protein DCZ04_13695 [Syntrophorhabdus aromaticivorans]|nr:hypothetical protein [Syntrophorhabdus aromaticivorans]
MRPEGDKAGNNLIPQAAQAVFIHKENVSLSFWWMLQLVNFGYAVAFTYREEHMEGRSLSGFALR